MLRREILRGQVAAVRGHETAAGGHFVRNEMRIYAHVNVVSQIEVDTSLRNPLPRSRCQRIRTPVAMMTPILD